MSQLERRLAEQLANAIEIDGELRRKLDQEFSERKKITEMYLESNQACIDAEADLSVALVKINDLTCMIEKAWWAGHNEGYRTTFEEWEAQQEGE